MYWQANVLIESSVDSREENGGVFLGFCLLYLSNLAFLVKVSVSPFQWNINQLSVGTRNIPTAPVHLAITTNLIKKSQPGRLFVPLRHHLEREPRKKPERRRGEQKLKTRSTKCLKVETVLRKSDCCSDSKVLSGDSWGCCAQATALLPLTRGVIIHEILLVTLFLEVVHSRVVHPPGVRNKTVHFAPPPNRQILCSQICSRDESLCVLANVHDPTETPSKFRRN